MNIGKLYQVKEFFWFLYPSKEIVSAATIAAVARLLDTGAPYWSNRFKCNVSYISPNSVFCLLEKDGVFIKVLTTNGELGWIKLVDLYSKDIEEVKV